MVNGRSKNLQRGALAAAKVFEEISDTAVVSLSSRKDNDAGINRFDAILDQLDAVQDILARKAPERLLMIGGDCAIDIGIIDYLVGRHPDLTVIWVDSHFDANTPETTPSGNLHGMPVAAIIGEAPQPMRSRLRHPLAPERFRYVWANISDEGDRAFQEAKGLQWLADDEPIVGPVHVHFDLNVLHPNDFPYLAYAEDTGMPLTSALALMQRLSVHDVVGLTFTEFAPASDQDASKGIPAIRALYGALQL